MNIQGKHYRTIWVKEDNNKIIQIIDQRPLPHKFVIEDISTVDQMYSAIKDMHLRGAGLIGAAAGYGMYLAVLEASSDSNKFDELLFSSGDKLKSSRPTAVNLKWAVHRQLDEINKGNYSWNNIFNVSNIFSRT